MEQKLYMSHCPICGRVLFKGLPNSYIEGGCPKCKSYIKINYTEAGVVCTVAKAIRETDCPDCGGDVK